MTINTLRRRLVRAGYRLRSRGGYFQISDLSTGGLVHDGGVDGFPLSFANAVECAVTLCS